MKSSVSVPYKYRCRGRLFGGRNKSEAGKWDNGYITSINRKAVGFMISECKRIGKMLDITNCYNNDNLWAEC